MLVVILILVMVSAVAYVAYKKYLADKEETEMVKEALSSVKLNQEDVPPFVDEEALKKSQLDALAEAQKAKAEVDALVAEVKEVVEKADEVLATPSTTEIKKPVEEQPVKEESTQELQATPKPAAKKYYRRKNKPKK